MNKTFYTLFVLFLFLSGLIGTVFLLHSRQKTGSKAVETAALSLSTASTTVNPGDDVLVTILIAPTQSALAGVDVTITYPSNILQAKKFEKGSLLPLALKPPQIDQRNAKMILASSPREQKKDGGILATLTLTAIKAGQATIAFDPATKVALVGQKEDATGTFPTLTITVINPTPSPTSIPTPTQQPQRR